MSSDFTPRQYKRLATRATLRTRVQPDQRNRYVMAMSGWELMVSRWSDEPEAPRPKKPLTLADPTTS